MATRLERLKVTMDDLREEARDLEARPHHPEQMGTFVRSGATALERVLRSTELPEVGANASFYNLIEGLTGHGLSDSGARALHALRTAANADKHDPQSYQDWRETERVLRNARGALDALDRAAVAGLHEPADRPYEREFVVATYDYFHTGETEFYVFPNVPEHRPPLEVFQMDYTHEHEALVALERSGELRWGKGTVPAEVWADLANSSDFYRAGLFAGTYRDLVAAFAPHQHGRALLPALQRSSNTTSVRAAILMALVDLVYDEPATASELDLDRLLDHAAAEYAISREHPTAKRISECTLALIEPLSADERAALKGPQWRTVADLKTQGKYKVAEDLALGIVIRDDGTIIIGQDR